MKKNMLNEGFSLMETLIWVGIVGIFVSAVGVSGVTFMNKAKVRGAMQELKVFSMALLDYYETEGVYPSQEEGLEVLLKEKYITKTTFKDPWKNPYHYEVMTDPDGFIITSYGADKQEGGVGTAKDLQVSSDEKSDEME